MGGTTSKYGAKGIGAQRSRVMSMALDRVRDEGVPLGEALQQSWQFVANEALGINQTPQAPPTPPAPVKESLDNFSIAHSYGIAIDIKRQYGSDAIRPYLTEFYNLYTIDELKAINKIEGIDRSGRVRNSKNKQKIVDIMASRVAARATQGDAFRNYQM